MAKRGRRSIRNKRKSVKKYSSKRRSKTMRYLIRKQSKNRSNSKRSLRGGLTELEEYNIRKNEIRLKDLRECQERCARLANPSQDDD